MSMDKLQIKGGIPLKGIVKISGAKNACLPLMTACLLTDQPLVLENVPNLADVHSLANLLQSLGVSVSWDEIHKQITLRAQGSISSHADYDLVRKMRASILVLGPLLARNRKAVVSLPGGCAIGTRPVDLHLKGLEKLGACIELKDGYIYAEAPHGLKGADIAFPMVSVTGTENLMMAAVFAPGETRLLNAAREPEVLDLARCLVKMGADIQGIGTDTLVIRGVQELKGITHTVVPDRIEMGTYIMAALITKGCLEIQGASLELLPTVRNVLEDTGAIFEKTAYGFHVHGQYPLKSVNMITEPYPGLPTDLQAQFMALMCVANGSSSITETIFENRFMHVAELVRMGASIHIHGSTAVVQGGDSLKGAPVMATDLRASASLVLAGLAAQGETVISRIYHLDRGYEVMEEKLKSCGASIERIA